MEIKIVGAGPAGLYFAALMKQHDPSRQITIFESGRRDATWGFGVVFSDRALEFLRADDEALYQYLTITNLEQLGNADLIVGANGAFSWIRRENEEKFGTTTDWRPNKFIWYGTTKAFNSLTLTFRETKVGVFCAHHYRYRSDRSTFIVEVAEATWRRAGFETMDSQAAIRYCERVFAKDLDGHPVNFEQLVLAEFPRHLERALGFRECGAVG